MSNARAILSNSLKSGSPAADEFKEFRDEYGIDHIRRIPYWPQSIGEVERFNESVENYQNSPDRKERICHKDVRSEIPLISSILHQLVHQNQQLAGRPTRQPFKHGNTGTFFKRGSNVRKFP